MQKGKLSLGEAATPSSLRVLVLGATRVHQESAHAGTAASLTVSPGRQFTSQAGRLAGDCLPRTTGGYRVTHSCVPSPPAWGLASAPSLGSQYSPARNSADASHRLLAAHLRLKRSPALRGVAAPPDGRSGSLRPKRRTERSPGAAAGVRRAGTSMTVQYFTYTIFDIYNIHLIIY